MSDFWRGKSMSARGTSAARSSKSAPNTVWPAIFRACCRPETVRPRRPNRKLLNPPQSLYDVRSAFCSTRATFMDRVLFLSAGLLLPPIRCHLQYVHLAVGRVKDARFDAGVEFLLFERGGHDRGQLRIEAIIENLEELLAEVARAGQAGEVVQHEEFGGFHFLKHFAVALVRVTLAGGAEEIAQVLIRHEDDGLAKLGAAVGDGRRQVRLA